MRRLHRDLTESEHEEALKELAAAHRAVPLPIKERDKQKSLLRIIHDTTEPHHVRSEAQRILDVSDVRPADFAYRYAEFMDHYTPAATPYEINQ
jgi:hypothetical protein